MAWGDYAVLPQLSGFTDSSLPSIADMKTYGIAIGYNSSDRQQYNVALDGYFVKIAYLSSSSSSYLGIILAGKQWGANYRVGAYLTHLDIGGNEYYRGPDWSRILLDYDGTNDYFFYDYGTNLGQVWPAFRNPDIPVYEASSMREAADLALAAMDDGIWEEPVASDSLIKHATVKFDYPVEGLPLSTTIVSATVDNGEVTAGTISWKKDGEPYSGLATAGDRYTAVFTLQSTTAKFAQAIGQYINTINTAERTDVFVKSVGAQFPSANLGLISVGVNFSAVGNTDPYYGDPDIESDPIEEPELPTLSAVDTGFLTLYNPTLTEVQNLATYMWNADLTTIEFWKKVVADPIDMILGFSLVPCAVPDGGSKSVVIGGVDTGVSMTKAASQFVRIDCGSVTINEEYGNYLDYEPYTKCELYLPYCGTHPISIDDIMGKTVHITYHVDILSGACVAYVMVNEVVYYMFAGNCAVSLPVTSQQFSDLIRSSISLVADVGALVATGGLSAPLAGTGSQAAQIGRAIRGATMGIDTAAGAASTVMSMKPRMARSGNIGSMAGQLANQVPYFIFTHPRMSVADSQQSYQGYPTNQTYQLGSLSGFTQVQSIHLTGIPCTDDEITEIYSLLSAGVII